MRWLALPVDKNLFYSQSPLDFCREIKTDPSFHNLSTEDFDITVLP